jgi:hypothetical protein
MDAIVHRSPPASPINVTRPSSKGAIYPEMKVAMAAHANLWNEANPKLAIDTFHLIALPKDGGAFKHHAFDDLDREWQTFKVYREAWRLEKEWVAEKKVAKATSKTEAPVKPRIRVKAHSIPSLTMAEMLRAYGHVKEVRA